MSSGFISESEILEARRVRQEEWEKVRTDDQPQEAPEEEYDSRPLYQRLEEQRLRKEAEYEEAHKLKNMIRGLDDDEVGFLDLVEHSKAQAAQQISLEEKKEMQEFREYKSSLAESEEIRRLKAQLAPARPTPASGQQAQKNKLQGIVVRKRKASEIEGEKPNSDVTSPKNKLQNKPQNGKVSPVDIETGAMQCVGILPGLGHYDTDSTSESEDSSDNDSNDTCCKRDLLGRRPDQSADKQKEETKT